MYAALGGMDTCRRLSTVFYAHVARDPVLRPLFPSLHCAVESLARFLTQFLGGPCEYSEGRWFLSLREAHLRFKIGKKERDAWMRNMRKALAEVVIDDGRRRELERIFEQASTFMINHPRAVESSNGGEISPEWALHLKLEETIAAVRAGEAVRAISLIEDTAMRGYFMRDRAAFLSLLAMMSGTGHAEMIDYTRRELNANPALVRERYTYGRTLLHGVAEAGCAPMVEVLLRLGADPNARDRFGHTPLYAVGNAMSAMGSSDVVQALAAGGADVNIQDNVKRCTALHMAARRGNVAVAKALLNCGADMEIEDRAGVTALGRAKNCRKREVVALLMERGKS